MRPIYFIILNIVLAGAFWFLISHANAGITFVRSSSEYAHNCYVNGKQPKNLVHISKPYGDFGSCYDTIGHSVDEASTTYDTP